MRAAAHIAAAIASAVLCAGSGAAALACTIMPSTPEPYGERLAHLARPLFAETVRAAVTVDRARVSEHGLGAPHIWPSCVDRPEDCSSSDVRDGHYVFTVVERLKGASQARFPYRALEPAMYPAASPEQARKFDEWGADRPKRHAEWHRNIMFWDMGELAVGEQTAGMGDCSVPVVFGDLDYLIFRDANGAFLGAEPLTGPDDELLAAVRALIADPELDFAREMMLEDYLGRHTASALVAVQDCTRPAVRVERPLAGEIPDFMLDVSRQPWWTPGSSFNRLPIDAAACRRGMRFVAVDSGGNRARFYPVTEDGLADFREVASQVRVTDPGLIPLAEAEAWLGAAR